MGQQVKIIDIDPTNLGQVWSSTPVYVEAENVNYFNISELNFCGQCYCYPTGPKLPQFGVIQLHLQENKINVVLVLQYYIRIR